MEELSTALLIYLAGHMWWLTYRIGRLEGEVKKLNEQGLNHDPRSL